MRFVITLTHHIKTVFIAEIIQIVIIWIMRGPDCVDIVLLHQTHILLINTVRNILSGIHIRIVAVDTLNQKTLAIKLYHVITLGCIIIFSIGRDLRRCKCQLPKSHILADTLIMKPCFLIIQ